MAVAAEGQPSTSQGLRFAQLSSDLTELRWAYNAYLLVASVENVELCPPPVAYAVRSGRRRSALGMPRGGHANDIYGTWVRRLGG